MYDDELDMTLESAYDDGYVQALLDMDADIDDIAEEDVDMFDDNYFDEAMEGPAAAYRKKMNAGKTKEEIQEMRNRNRGSADLDPRYSDGDHVYPSGQRHFNSNKAGSLYSSTYRKDSLARRKQLRDDYIRSHDTEMDMDIRHSTDYKHAKNAENKVRAEYNAKTRAQYNKLKDKLQSSNLSNAQKRAVMEKFRDRKFQEKLNTIDRAYDAYSKDRTRVNEIRDKQNKRRYGWDDNN